MEPAAPDSSESGDSQALSKQSSWTPAKKKAAAVTPGILVILGIISDISGIYDRFGNRTWLILGFIIFGTVLLLLPSKCLSRKARVSWIIVGLAISAVVFPRIPEPKSDSSPPDWSAHNPDPRESASPVPIASFEVEHLSDAFPVVVDPHGSVDQGFTARTSSITKMNVILGCDPSSRRLKGLICPEDNAKFGNARFVLKSLADGHTSTDVVEMVNNGATEVRTDRRVTVGDAYVLTITNDSEYYVGFYVRKGQETPANFQGASPGSDVRGVALVGLIQGVDRS